MHQAATPSNEESVATSAQADINRQANARGARSLHHKFIRRIVCLIIVASAVVITLYVWGIVERHPRTDDATARANVVGIAPRVSGQILKLNVQDNQAVKEGDVLFEIDPEDYRLILEKAKAELAALDHQIAQAHDTLRRLEPLLPNGFTTAETVDKARTAGDNSTAQTPRARVATINLEELHLSYCKVIAPFSGRVINLNISAGAHVTAGFPPSRCLTQANGTWSQIFAKRKFDIWLPGAKRLFTSRPRLTSAFVEKCRESGWAVKPEGEIDLPPAGVPYVKRELNWVRVAQRFPVRIEVENPDPDLFRMGASAVAIIKGPPPK